MNTETQPAEQQTGFQVRLSNFEGPFDLLLQLIFAHRLDVTEVALSQVTDEFIAHIKAHQAAGPEGEGWDLEQTTSFLLVASTLLDLKAARLLPQAEVEDEEDLALLEALDLLFARLLQYRAYKQVAAVLEERWVPLAFANGTLVRRGLTVVDVAWPTPAEPSPASPVPTSTTPGAATRSDRLDRPRPAPSDPVSPSSRLELSLDARLRRVREAAYRLVQDQPWVGPVRCRPSPYVRRCRRGPACPRIVRRCTIGPAASAPVPGVTRDRGCSRPRRCRHRRRP